MSEDEDDPDTVPGRTATQWVSRAPDYRSDIAKELYKAIDAISDPDPDKEKAATIRVRGTEIKNAVPPAAKRLDNRVRAWQVKSSVLEANPHWLTKGRVARSGKLWGDAEDPEENVAPKRKRQTGLVAAGPSALKRPRGTVPGLTDVENSKTRLEELLDGEDVASVLDRD